MFATNFGHRYIKLLDNITLNELSKNIIRSRYVTLVESIETDYKRTYFAYILLTTIITISGVLITAFVSFDKLSLINNITTQAFLWVVWALGILLTLSNKWLYVFNIPKKHILNVVILEKLYSEGWSFISAIGKYKDISDIDLRFKLFCTRIEKIKMKSLEVIPEMDNTNVITDVLSMGSDGKNNADDDLSINVAIKKPPLRSTMGSTVRMGKPPLRPILKSSILNNIDDQDQVVIVPVDNLE